jgi:hypothetical protein
MRHTVVCSAKDEGPFLVEWVTWYRLIGFTDIVIVTNDCTDHSPQLLDALAAAGWVTHLVRDVPDGRQICAVKLQAAKALPQVGSADWVLVCDVDEFLVIHVGDGSIGALINSVPEPFLGMSINWRVFGTSGHVSWQDGLVHRQFTLCAPPASPVSGTVKSITSHPDWFRRLGEHGPKKAIPGRMGGPWGSRGLRWITPDGRSIDDWKPGGEYLRRLPRALTSHKVAQMNHYMVRSTESFTLKKGTPSSVAAKDRYTDEYFERFNRNEIEDTTASRHAAAFDALHAEAMALPGVAALHHQCCADYVARLARKEGRDPAADPRHAFHLARANEMRAQDAKGAGQSLASP